MSRFAATFNSAGAVYYVAPANDLAPPYVLSIDGLLAKFSAHTHMHKLFQDGIQFLKRPPTGSTVGCKNIDLAVSWCRRVTKKFTEKYHMMRCLCQIPDFLP